MRIEQMPDAVRGQAQLHYRLPAQAGVQAPRRVLAVQQSSAAEDGAVKVGTAPPDDAIMLDLSPEGREAARKAALEEQAKKAAHGQDAGAKAEAPDGEGPEAPAGIDDRVVDDLLQQDRAARGREQTMRAAAGSLPLGAASYAYKVGPDGRLYVVESSVNFDLTEIPGDPEATLRKAEQIRKAALAPSPQDRATAALAASMALRARHVIQQKQSAAGAGSRLPGLQK